MTAPEDPLGLLEWLKQHFPIEESDPLHGPSLVVPNSEYKPEWTRLLNEAGYRVYAGEQASRVAWIIPLKAKHWPGQRVDKPFINELSVDSQLPIKNKDPDPSRGCITGRPWTQAEDEQILAVLEIGHGVMEIARELAPKLDRSEEAIKIRLLRLKRRKGMAGETTPAREKLAENPAEKRIPASSEPAKPKLHSLLESALLLSEDPKHHAALRLVLEACLRLATPNQEK